MLDFSVTCPNCGKKDDPSDYIHELFWVHEGYFTANGDEKFEVVCSKCGHEYIYSCRIIGIEPAAEIIEKGEK